TDIHRSERHLYSDAHHGNGGTNPALLLPLESSDRRGLALSEQYDAAYQVRFDCCVRDRFRAAHIFDQPAFELDKREEGYRESVGSNESRVDNPVAAAARQFRGRRTGSPPRAV